MLTIDALTSGTLPTPLPGRAVSVAVVFGTRPEAVKLAPVVRALSADVRFRPHVIHTGQHTALAADVLAAFDITADVTLDLLRPGQGLVELLGRAVIEIGQALEDAMPDVVVVQGDTTTATAAALAATQLAVPVVHVEAGLRSGDRMAPFPEEDNRRIISTLADLHLAPTDDARRNLVASGVDIEAIVVTGNSGIDALDTIVAAEPTLGDPVVARALDHDGPLMLVTTHRRESWGETMSGIAAAVRHIAEDTPGLLVVLPMHPNPTVRSALLAELADCERVVLCEPLPYVSLAHVLVASTLVLTDSGGLQEEAPRLGVPVLVLRDTTERPEGVDAGASILVGTDPDSIVKATRALLHDGALLRRMAIPRAIYGDGRAAERTVAAVAHRFGLGERPEDFVPAVSAATRHRRQARQSPTPTA